MRTFTAAGLLAIAVAALLAQPPLDYSLGPDSQEQPDVPKGTLTRHVLAPGKFFPGTPLDTPRDLQRMVSTTPVGKVVRVMLLRAGQKKEVEVTIGRYKEREERSK